MSYKDILGCKFFKHVQSIYDAGIPQSFNNDKVQYIP